MIDLLSVYVCPKCGEILEDQIETVPIIDCINDEVWEETICQKCNHSVTRKLIDGQVCFQSVDHERWLWATGYYDELLEE